MKPTLTGLAFASALIATGLPGSAQDRSASGPASAAPPVKKELSRHEAARAAGFRALHLCTGLFTSEMNEATVRASMTSSSVAADAFSETIDRENRTVSVGYSEDMPPRIAVWRDNLGCTQLPIGADMTAAQNLLKYSDEVMHPDLDSKNWPLGDLHATASLPAPKSAALEAVLDEAFRDQDGAYLGDTWGIAVIKDGMIISERYAEGYGMHVSARTNSMCKSLSASLVGTGVEKGLLDLHARVPLKEWQTPGDPRGDITLNDMLHMASGMYTEGTGNPQMDIYGAGAPASEISADNMMTSAPGRRFVYSGSDTILSVRALREAFDNDEAFISYPATELMWKIGMTRTVMETDWRNDFLGSGQCWSTVRDFGRLGLLYLGDGMWNNERILPEGWSDYVSALAPAQPSNYGQPDKPGYGGQFWIYDGIEGLPEQSYAAAGAFGQYAMIVQPENLVVVRRGMDKGNGFDIAKFTADVISALGEAS